MKTLILFILFLGLFFVMNGIYEQKLQAVQKEKEIEYKFIPRSLYEEQLSKESTSGLLDSKFPDMFGKASPWFDQFIGPGLDILRTEKALAK